MASYKLMMNMSSRNSDLIKPKSSNSSSSTNHKNSGMTLDAQITQQQPPNATLLDAQIDAAHPPATLTLQETARASSKSVDDAWKEIVAGRRCKQEVPDELMTLEDFLVKAGAAVKEEDVKLPPSPLPFSYDIHAPNVKVDAFGIGVEEVGGRGKRRAILETLDKAAQQRQRRMIKNRESAARSRERKQAYQAELESLAVKLEEENETLLKVKKEQTRKRYKQLMDNIIPVTEKRRPTRYMMRKVRSMEW